MLFKFITVIVLNYVAVYSVYGTAIHVLELDKTTCLYKIYYVSEHDSVQVEWDGIQLPSNCKMSFFGRDITDDTESHEVCVEAWTYDVNDCNFTMKFFSGHGSGVAAREYSCNNGLPPKFCADQDEYLDIQFEATSSSTSNVTLLVTGNATYEKHMTMVYVGVSIVVIVCIAVVGVMVFTVYRKRKQQQRQGIMLQQSISS